MCTYPSPYFHTYTGMTKAMAKEFATRGVTVNSVCPGFIGRTLLPLLFLSPFPSSPAALLSLSLSPSPRLSLLSLSLARVAHKFTHLLALTWHTESDMTAELNAEYMDEVKKMIPLGRLGYASEVAGMCAFLVRPATKTRNPKPETLNPQP